MVAEGPVQGAQFGNDNVQFNSFGTVQGDVVHVAGNYTVQHFGTPSAIVRAATVPVLSSGTVRRDGLIRAAVDALCRPEGGRRVALAGAGGLGKTTMATAVCREGTVTARYPGGVVWVSVGQGRAGAALAQAISQVAYTVTGREASIIDPDQAVRHLASSLAPGSLVVVDDVWTADQLAPFRFLGEHGCLVTTRNLTSLPLDVEVIAVGEMSDAEARELLSARTGPLSDSEIAEIFAVTGRWPLLLALVNGFLTRYATPGQSISGYLAAIQRLLRSGRNSITAVLETSLSFLEDVHGSTTLDSYVQLAIFTGQDAVPLDVLSSLWQVEPAEAEDLCLLFSELSLVDEFGLEPPQLRLHDIVRDHLVARAGDTIVSRAHERLLEAVRRKAPRWWLMDANDYYLWHHLRDHFLGAHREAEWASLVIRPEWVAAKLETVGVVALYADLDDPAIPAAQPILRAVSQSRHLLVDSMSPGALTATLLSRLPPSGELAPFAAGLRSTLNAPALITVLPLPDRPEPSLHNTFADADQIFPIRTLVAGSRTNELTGVSNSKDDKVRVWDLATGRTVTQSARDGDVIKGGARAGSRWLVIGSETVAYIWDRDEHRIRGHVPTRDRRAAACAVPDHLEWIVLGAEDGSLRAVSPLRPDQVRAEAPPSQVAVVSCAVTPDSRHALGLRRDGSVTMWSVRENAFRTVEAPSDFDGVAVSIEARGETAIVASSGQDRGIFFFDVRGGEWLGSLQTTAVLHGDLPVSRDGRLLVTVEPEQPFLNIWDVSLPQRPALLHRLMPHDDMVTACVVSPDSTALGVGYQGGEAFVVGLGETLRPARLTGHEWPVVSVCFSPDGSWLATSEFGPGPVRVHTNVAAVGVEGANLPEYVDPDTGRPLLAARGVRMGDPNTWDFVREIAGQNHKVKRCAAGHRQPWLITYGMPTVTWGVPSGRAIRLSRRRYSSHSGFAVAMSETVPDLPVVADSAESFGVAFTEVWNPRTGETLFRLPTYQKEAVAVGGVRRRPWVVTAADDDATALTVWDLAAGKRLHNLYGYPASASTVRPALNDSALVAISTAGGLDVIDIASGTVRYSMRAPGGGRYTSMVLADDSRTAFTSTAEGRVVMIDLSTGAVTAQRGSGMQPVRVLHGDPRRPRVVIAGEDAVAGLDLLGGTTIEIATPAARCLAVSADQAFLCSAYFGQGRRFSTVLVHETATGALLAELHIEGALDDCAWVGNAPLVCLVGDRGIYLLRLGQGTLPGPVGEPGESDLAGQVALVVSSANLSAKAPAYARLAVHVAERSADSDAIARAWNVTGICYARQEDHARARDAFQRSRDLRAGLAENDETIDMLLNLADSIAASGDQDLALACALEAMGIARHSDHLGGIAARAVARYAIAAGRPAEAARALRTAAHDDRVDEVARCLRLLAESDLPRGLGPGREEIARLVNVYEILGEAADLKWALLRLGDAEAREGSFGAAVLACLRARSILTETGQDDETMLKGLLRQHFDEAVEYAGRNGSPGDVANLFDMRAITLLDDGDANGALAVLDRRAAAPGASITLRLRTSRALTDARLFRRAVQVLLPAIQAVESHPEYLATLADLYGCLGAAYRGSGQNADAARAFERQADVLRPGRYGGVGTALLEAARIYSQVHDWPSAFRALDEAIGRMREMRENSYAQDATYWTELLGDALLLTATGAAETGGTARLDDACAEVAALVTDPIQENRSGRLILLAAEITEKAGRLPEAVGYYRKLLDCGATGDEAFVQWSIGSLTYQLGHWDECAAAALRSAEEYLERSEPRNARLGFSMAGRAFSEAGRHADAVSAFERCRKLYSFDDDDPKEIGEIIAYLAKARMKTLFRRGRGQR